MRGMRSPEAGRRGRTPTPRRYPRVSGEMCRVRTLGHQPSVPNRQWGEQDSEHEIAKLDRMIAELDLTIEQLALALESRTTTAAAVGVVMARFEMDIDVAFEYLRRLSQDANLKLYTIARRIVETRRVP